MSSGNLLRQKKNISVQEKVVLRMVLQLKTTQQYQGSREERSRVTPVVFDPKVHGVLKCLRRRLCHRATCGCDLGRKRRRAGLLDVM